MTTHDDRQRSARERIIAARKKLEVFTRRDEQDRIFASDGEHEYEVAVTLEDAGTNCSQADIPKVVIGRRSLECLESGDITALFWWGVKPHSPDQRAVTTSDRYASNCLLDWTEDWESQWGYDNDEDVVIAAEVDFRTYYICPVRDDDGEILGYRIAFGDVESGYDWIGEVAIDGEPGERSLEDAKAIADAHCESWLREVVDYQSTLEHDLFIVVSGWKDREGNPRIRRDERRIFYRSDDPGVGEIEIVATVDEFDDGFDAPTRRWIVSGSTLSNSSDRLESLLESEIIRHANAFGRTGSQRASEQTPEN